MNITETVFPVYAGVILSWSATLTVRRGVPRVCGGDPDDGKTWLFTILVFPVYAGVIPITPELI